MIDLTTHTPMLSEDVGPQAKESSVQFMLAEFDRIQAGELYNRGSGESRVTLYITLSTLMGACVLALWQLTDADDPKALQAFYSSSLAALVFVFSVGIITYRLLVERWRLTVIYLRKLARIRRWFLAQDPSLQGALVYSADDAQPSFVSRRFLASSLITFVSVLNGVAIAGTVMFLSVLLSPDIALLLPGILAGAVALLSYFSQRAFALRAMEHLDADDSAAFPSLGSTTLDNKRK